eukprot:3930278-Rhodomonas_salina.2
MSGTGSGTVSWVGCYQVVCGDGNVDTAQDGSAKAESGTERGYAGTRRSAMTETRRTATGRAYTIVLRLCSLSSYASALLSPVLP